MVAGLLAVLFLDSSLDRVEIAGARWDLVVGGDGRLPSGLALLAVIWVLVSLSARELQELFRAKGIAADAPMLALCGMAGSALVYLLPAGQETQRGLAVAATVIGLLFVTSLVRAGWGRRPQGTIAATAASMFGLVYLGVLPGFYLVIRHQHSVWVVAAVILIVKCCDIGAYATGCTIGRHRLVPWLSPGKTWEGLVGGVLTSAGVSAALVLVARRLGYAVPPAWSVPVALAGGALLGFVGQLGDLLASLLKRDAGIKDWAGSIPGFGGLLDVLDSPILAGPVAYWLLVAAGAGTGSPGSA
jgi:phosphatidate cytidylyltransferase